MKGQTFDNLMLIGRAGSGKSEFIDFLKSVPVETRREKFHIGNFKEVDDFPILFELFKDEDLWEEIGFPRKISKKKENVYVTVDYNLYNFCALRLNQLINKHYHNNQEFYNSTTLFIEYARGGAGCYKRNIAYFDKDILKNTAIFYIDNTYEESARRNMVRSDDKDKKQTILHHKIPVETMEWYKDHDWYELTNKKESGYLEINGVKIPYVSVWNEPECHDLKVLEERYKGPLAKLWELNIGR